MNVRFWGTRGSLPTPRPEMHRYGGNTSCVELDTGNPRHVVILDAGTGICPLGQQLAPEVERIDVLLTHLHMDHILGLGFFGPIFRPGLEVHLWGPCSTRLGLRARLTRYLSPPLFPVRLRDLPCRLTLHDTPLGRFEIPGLQIDAALVCHPGPTVGYRVHDGRSTVAYIPDHEPALASRRFPDRPEWTSGFDLASGADLLIHDAQYADAEYDGHIGWGHSAIGHALRLAGHAGVGHLVPFHHDPGHDDDWLDRAYAGLVADVAPCPVTPAHEGLTVRIPDELGAVVPRGAEVHHVR